MKRRHCPEPAAHGPHEWRRLLLTRDCPGFTVAPCTNTGTHPPHWHVDRHDTLCRGAGWQERCEHQVGILDECDDCRVA